MKIKQIFAPGVASGTSLMGYVKVTYADLVRVFGEPNSIGDGYKTDAEWILEIDDTTVTIYNYKDGKNYNGEDGDDVKDITDWHVGGYTKTAVDLVREALFLKKTKV